jgi:hypothetical protein
MAAPRLKLPYCLNSYHIYFQHLSLSVMMLLPIAFVMLAATGQSPTVPRSHVIAFPKMGQTW